MQFEMEQRADNTPKFDLPLFISQSKVYFDDIVSRLLIKAKKFDKGLPKIINYLKTIDQDMQVLEE
jgi:hypothetical protein